MNPEDRGIVTMIKQDSANPILPQSRESLPLIRVRHSGQAALHQRTEFRVRRHLAQVRCRIDLTMPVAPGIPNVRRNTRVE